MRGPDVQTASEEKFQKILARFMFPFTEPFIAIKSGDGSTTPTRRRLRSCEVAA